MKYFKVENNKVEFTIDGSSWTPIDQINKDHLLLLIDIALTDDFEMDEFVKENISNQAHQIIYKQIFEKLRDLHSNQKRFKDESEAIYKAAIEKYSNI